MEMKQRIIGIIVLIALGVILVPLIFDSEAQSPVPADAQMVKEANAQDPKAKHLHKVIDEDEPEQDVAEDRDDSSDKHTSHEFKAEHIKPAVVEAEDEVAETPEIDEAILHKPVAEITHKKNKQPMLEAEAEETIESAPIENEEPVKVDPKPLNKAQHKAAEPKVVAHEEGIKIEPKPLAKSQTKPVAKTEHKNITAQTKKPLSKPESIKKDIEREIDAEMAQVSAGWAVQLGVFADRSNANELVKRLQKQGFHAFVKIDNSGKKKTAKVFIGPESTRQAADKTLKALKNKTQQNGIVVRYRA